MKSWTDPPWVLKEGNEEEKGKVKGEEKGNW